MTERINYFGISLFLFGLFSTTPIIALIIHGQTISLFTIIIPIMAILLVKRFDYKRVFSNKVFLLIILFFIIAIISTFVGHLYFKNDVIFSDVSISSLPKAFIWLVLAVLFAGAKMNKNEVEFLAKGFMVGTLANLIWACLDGIIFYIFNFSITNVLFSEYIKINNIRLEMLSIIIPTNNTIRVGGFNYDPAHIGVLAPIALGYGIMKRNRFIEVISIIALIMSQSTLGIVGMAFVFLLIVIMEPQKEVKIMILKDTMILASIVMIFVTITKSWDILMIFLERIFGKLGSSGTDNLRVIYNFKVIEAFRASPISGILGTGFKTASYPYLKAGLIESAFAFDPESTYISYFFDVGILGLITWITVMISICVNCMKICFQKRDTQSVVAFLGIVSTISSCFFYHYILYAVHLVIVIIGALTFSDNQGKKISKQANRRSVEIEIQENL